MAQAGLLASAVVISDPDFANLLRDYIPTVVSRQVWGSSDAYPAINGNEDHDRKLATDYYFGQRHFHTLRCRKDVYVQLVNEQSVMIDGFFYDQLMIEAEKEGYKLCIHNDSGGAPGDSQDGRALFFTAGGMAESDTFVKYRGISVRRAARNGHIYGWHSYGDITTGKYNRSDDPGVYQWFSGRGFEFLSIFPKSERPKNLITEFGSGATQFTNDLGFDEYWSNYTGFERYAQSKSPEQMDECLGVSVWSFGGTGDFPGQFVDKWIPQFIAKQQGH